MVSKTGSIKNGVVGSDLLEERAKCNFVQKDLTHFLFGGEQSYKQFQDWISDMESDPILKNSHHYYELSKEEGYKHQLQKMRRLFELNRTKYFLEAKPDYF